MGSHNRAAGFVNLYITVFPIWGIAYGPEIAQTITALHTFLGAVLVVDTVNYINKKKKDGMM